MKNLFSSRVCLGIYVFFVALCLSGCATMSFVGYSIAPDYPEDETETINISGLEKEVKIYLDDYGIGHIEAQNLKDMLRAVGFYHGRNRFFQMDMIRRMSRGRLTEILGERKVAFGTTLDLDVAMRGWGKERASQKEADSLDPETKNLMLAYVAGVNSALELYPPVEYRLLGVEPQPWTIVDSFAVGNLVAWSVLHNWQQELSRLLLALHVGVERAAVIYPAEPWHGNSSVKIEADPKELPPAIVSDVLNIFPPRPYQKPVDKETQTAYVETKTAAMSGASNAWVVGGKFTESGKPLLASDPHLPHMLPSMFIQQHMRCPQIDAIGISVPGVPFVLVGHNQKVAWGVTAAVADVIDLYIEKQDPNDSNKVIGPEGPEKIEDREEVFKILDGSEYLEKKRIIRHTKRGPLLNDMYPGLLPEWAPLVSLKYYRLEAGRGIRAFLKSNMAQSVDELHQALLGVSAPASTILAGDVDGNAAIFLVAKVAVRKNHRGTFPVPAWNPDFAWNEFLSPEKLPFFKEKESGMFAHGNNLMYDPYRGEPFYQVDSAPAYRLDRITEMLKKNPKHNFSSYSAMHNDIYLKRAERVAPKMLDILKKVKKYSPIEEEAIKLLSSWDYNAKVDSAAALIFFRTYLEAMRDAIVDEVDARAMKFLLSQRYFVNAADLWFDNADHIVWDNRATEKKEVLAECLQVAFQKAIKFLVEKYGEDTKEWRWGSEHDRKIAHFFGKELESFNLEESESPGGMDAVWKSHFDLGKKEHPFRVMAGPVLRMIVDFADMENAKWIIDTGSSGWPKSPHYGDQHEIWKNGGYIDMVSNWAQIQKSATAVLTLISK
jgi:penicillin amidase